MTTSALFVDLPNFYSHLVTSGIADATVLRDYFLSWFDFDRLAHKLTGEFSSVWVFYSGGKLGPTDARVDGKYLVGYIDRINELQGVSAYDVDIAGKQREQASYQCEECGHEGVAQWESEKGIDASLTVRLFDTMDTWDVAYLLSGDADFVPAVRSLRRRGQIVRGAGFAQRSSALVRECYDYLDLGEVFVDEDLAARELFGVGGVAAAWLTDPVSGAGGVVEKSESVGLGVGWERRVPVGSGDIDDRLCIDDHTRSRPHFLAYLYAHGAPIEESSRCALVRHFEARFPRCLSQTRTGGEYNYVFSPSAWIGVRRRLEELAGSVGARLDLRGQGDYGSLTFHYEYDPSAERYVAVPGDSSAEGIIRQRRHGSARAAMAVW